MTTVTVATQRLAQSLVRALVTGQAWALILPQTPTPLSSRDWKDWFPNRGRNLP